jgi:opacity protein-like surface antigen
MKANGVVFWSLSALLSGGAMAGSMGSVVPSWTRVMTLSAGPVWTNSGDTQSFYLQPEIEKTSNADKNTSTLFSGEFYYGWQHPLNALFSGQIGLAVAATSNATISGQIWQDTNPEYNNSLYTYKINHTHVAAKGKLLAGMGQMLTLYVSGSVGVGFNHAYRFSNIPILVEVFADPNFSSHSQTAFTYTVGIGLQRAITQNWQAGIGYEFADWGQSQLGLAPGQTMGSGLSLSHLYTNGLLFNISYLA